VKKNPLFVFTTALLTIGGLVACAQPSPSQSAKVRESNQVEVETAKAAAASDAAAQASVPENGNAESPRMETASTNSSPKDPAVSSAVLLQRVLNLVDSLRAPGDVTRSHLEEVMQVKLEPDAELQGWWWYTGSADGKWEYTIKVDERSKDDSLPRIDISFSAGDIEGKARAKVCTYELEAFAQSLIDLGYIRHPGWKQPGGHLVFSREAESARFSTSVKVRKYVQQIGAGEKDYQYCVYAITVSAGELLDGK
jgi:hypothetical protein